MNPGVPLSPAREAQKSFMENYQFETARAREVSLDKIIHRLREMSAKIGRNWRPATFSALETSQNAPWSSRVTSKS